MSPASRRSTKLETVRSSRLDRGLDRECAKLINGSKDSEQQIAAFSNMTGCTNVTRSENSPAAEAAEHATMLWPVSRSASCASRNKLNWETQRRRDILGRAVMAQDRYDAAIEPPCGSGAPRFGDHDRKAEPADQEICAGRCRHAHARHRRVCGLPS